MPLTREQLISNIDSLEQQGASKEDIQGYLDSHKPVRKEEFKITDVPVGMAKGLGSTVFGVGSLAQKGIKAITGKSLGLPEQKPDILTPKTPGERFGFGAEQIGEFFAPGGIIKKAGTSLLKKTALEAGTTGALVSAQEGDVNKKSLDASIIAGAFPLAGKVLSNGKTLFGNAKKEFAPRIINSIIKPLQKDLSYGKNPGRAVAQEGIVANSLDELATKIGERKKRIGEEIGQITKEGTKRGIKIDLNDAMKPIDEAIARAQQAPRTNAIVIQRLRDAKADLLKETVDQSGNIIQGRNLINISPDEAFAFKQTISDITKFTGNQSDDKIVNKALKGVYGSTKEKLNKSLSGIKIKMGKDITTLNEKFADLSSAEIATIYRDKIVERQNLISLNQYTAGIGTGVVALLSGAATLPAVLYGIGGGVLEGMTKDPKIMTRVATWLAKSTPEEKKRVFNLLPALKGIIIKNFIGEET